MVTENWYKTGSAKQVDVGAFRDLCNEGIDICDDDYFPEAGEEFAWDVREKLDSMLESAEDPDSVTARMVTAAENIVAGLHKWVR